MKLDNDKINSIKKIDNEIKLITKNNIIKTNSIIIKLDKETIDEIIEKKGKTIIKISTPDKNIETEFTYKNKSKNIFLLPL